MWSNTWYGQTEMSFVTKFYEPMSIRRQSYFTRPSFGQLRKRMLCCLQVFINRYLWRLRNFGKNWWRASVWAKKKKKMGLAWTHTEKKWWQHRQADTTVDTTKPQRNRTTQEHLKRDMKKEMWTTGFRYSWRKMEMVAWDTVPCVAHALLGGTSH